MIWTATAYGDWPIQYEDTIWVTTLPYTCMQDNTLYLLGYLSGSKPPYVWNDDLTSTGKGINTNGHSKIMISTDFTRTEARSSITYSTSHDVASYGILVSGGDSIRVEYLELLPGAGAVLDTNAVGILINASARHVLVSGCRVYTDGIDAKFVKVWPGNSNGIRFDYCYFHNYGNAFIRRDPVTNQSTAWGIIASFEGSPLAEGEFHLKVTNCEFGRSIHVSIGVLGVNVKVGSDVMGAVSIITNNIFHQRTRNDLYLVDLDNTVQSAVDPFAVNFDGIGAGTVVAYNSFYGDLTTNEYGGDGILVQGARGTEANPVLIHDNYFDLRHGAHPSAPAGKQAALAIYLRRYTGTAAAHSYNQWVQIFNNWGQTWVDTVTSTKSIGTYSEGIRVGLDSMTNNISIYNNHIPVKRSDGVTNGSGLEVAALSVSSLDSLMATDAWIGVYDNVFYSNYWEAPITPVWFGANRIGKPCSNVQLVGDTIYCPYDDHDSTAFYYSRRNTYYWHSTGNKIVDCVYGGYASDSDVVFGFINEASDGLGKTLEHWVTLSVLVWGSDSIPKPGAVVKLLNNYGDRQTLGISESDGWARGLVKYKFFGYDPNPSDEYVVEDSVAFNPFQITAISGTDSAFGTITITPTCKTDTLTLAPPGEIPLTGVYFMILKKRPLFTVP